MSLDVTIAGQTLPTSLATLKSFPSDLKLAFNLDSALNALINTPLSSVPSSASKSQVSYTSPAASWNPGGGLVQFGLQGGASGALEIVTGGDLVPYTDGLDSPQQKSIEVPTGVAYLKLTLNFNISANAAATYSGGAYGVTAALDTEDTYAIAFCKAFAPSKLLGIAIAQTFESFVLPLNKDTLALLSDGDYLLHDFDGNLHLSFGAYAGLDKVLYAGQSSVDVFKSKESSLATLSGGAQPEINASVALDFAFQYASQFEALLSKTGGTARLHLFRSQNATTSVTLKASLEFDANLTASITPHTQAAQDSLIKAAGGPGSAGGDAVKTVLQAGSKEIDKYTSEANDKLTSWLNRANGVQANLQVAIETSKSRTVLAGYDFDLSSPNSGAAWQAAIDGDLVKALQTGAVTLDVGSGLERAYQTKTTFSCNFFNLWKFASWREFSSNVKVVYAGNNVFHIVAQVGRTTETDSMGAMHNMDFYFSASADTVAGNTTGGNTSNISVDLHIDLTAQSDPKAADRIATMLGAIQGGPVCDGLATGMHAFAGNSKTGTAQLQVTIPASAYQRVQCDPYVGGQPSSSTANDAHNWTVFAQAADDLSAWPLTDLSTLSDQQLAFLKSFNAWVTLNEAANGSTKPNRVHPGNAFNIWPPSFPVSLDPGDRRFVVGSMLAAQAFMNFCDDLRTLASATDVNSVGTTWEGLLALITKAIQKDLNVDFLRPAALATIRLCKAPGAPLSNVAGPSAAAAPTDHFAVAIAL